MPDEPFEILTDIKYPPEIIDRTEEGARRGLLEGEEFMVLEVQVIGMVEKYEGKNSLTIDYLAACNQKALTSPWMKEKIRLLTDVCENTVMVINNRIRARLFSRSGNRRIRNCACTVCPHGCRWAMMVRSAGVSGTVSIRCSSRKTGLWGSGPLRRGGSRGSQWNRKQADVTVPPALLSHESTEHYTP